MTSIEQEIFRNGSTTYYWSSRFFPEAVRKDVFRLYSFVRVVDDYVDCVPQQTKKFKKVREMWQLASSDKSFKTISLDSDTIDERIVKNMVYVARKYSFDEEWVKAFLDSMAMDLDKRVYETIDDTLEYVYGSAEVIGLMMAKILDLPEKAYEAARLQGRAMQFINFIRDISEDNELGRCYIPKQDLRKFNLTGLQKSRIVIHEDSFRELIQFELNRYEQWQNDAYKGYEYIPFRLRVPLKTATDMYNWTAQQVAEDPMIVFDKKVKPKKGRILLAATRNMIHG